MLILKGIAQPPAFDSQHKIIKCTNTKMKLSVIKVHFLNNQDHNHLKLLQTSDIREAGRGSNRNQVTLDFLQLVFDFSTDFFFWVSGNLSVAIMSCLIRSDNPHLLSPQPPRQGSTPLLLWKSTSAWLLPAALCPPSSCCRWLRDLRDLSLPTLALISGLVSVSCEI